MSLVLQLIANEQQNLQTQKETKAKEKFDRRAQLVKAWHAAGIGEMWEDIKAIEVKNFAANEVLGRRAPLADFVIPHAECNVYGTGLELYHSSHFVNWYVDFNNANELIYHHCTSNLAKACRSVEEFQETFVTWMAKRIDPQLLTNLGIAAKPVKKSSRRILTEAGAK